MRQPITYLVQSKRPMRPVVVALLLKHGYRVSSCVRSIEFYLMTDEPILDILEVLEQETGTEFESVEAKTGWIDTGRDDILTGEMVMGQVVDTEVDTVVVYDEEIVLELVE